jgi:hypothetical protein
MLMATPTIRESLEIKQVLMEFSEASGMQINKENLTFLLQHSSAVQAHLVRDPRVPL